MVSEPILDPLTGHLPYYPRTKPKVLDVKGCIGKNPGPKSARDKAKIEYIYISGEGGGGGATLTP